MSWWTERQAGDVNSRSREELQEILKRQEKILLNKRFLQTLPDKGKKISDFAEKLRQTLADLEEKETRQVSLKAIGAEFQTRYQQAFTQRRCVTSDVERKTVNQEEESLDSEELDRECLADKSTETLIAFNEKTAASISVHSAKEAALVEALERVTLSGEKTVSHKDVKNSPRNPFCASQTQKKPHFLDVLERSSANARKPRFKPNQLPEKSGSSSPGQSPGSMIPLSAEERKQRDRKHLDDITAAKLPPLHHSPAQLLSLEESVTLLQEQTRKQQELQVKLAAKKLAEGLTVSMSSYNPDGGALAAYREVHDDGALSDED